MSEKRKHRHETDDVDHAPVTTERTTRGIQAILAVSIVLTGAVVLYALFTAGSGG